MRMSSHATEECTIKTSPPVRRTKYKKGVGRKWCSPREDVYSSSWIVTASVSMTTKKNLSSYQTGTFQFQCGICFPSSSRNLTSQQQLIRRGELNGVISHPPPPTPAPRPRQRQGRLVTKNVSSSPIPLTPPPPFLILHLHKSTNDWASEEVIVKDRSLLRKLDQGRHTHVYTHAHTLTQNTSLTLPQTSGQWITPDILTVKSNLYCTKTVHCGVQAMFSGSSTRRPHL